MKSYYFETKNNGTCEISVIGEWTGGTKDLAVTCGDLYREFTEMDGGSADEIFAWLMDSGVEFESKRSLYFNVSYVASAMLDGDETEASLLTRVAERPDSSIDEWFSLNF